MGIIVPCGGKSRKLEQYFFSYTKLCNGEGDVVLFFEVGFL